MYFTHVTFVALAGLKAMAAPLEEPAMPGPRAVGAVSAPVNLTAFGHSYRLVMPRDDDPDDRRILPFINEFDRAYGIPEKKWDPDLVHSIRQTLEIGHGQDEIHHLYPPTMAQVLCPGRYDFNPSTGSFTPFGIVYYGWLCEKEHDSQLQGKCPEVWKHGELANSDGGETGHHDILTHPQYTAIGCAFYQNPDQHNPDDALQGIWGCDLRP